MREHYECPNCGQVQAEDELITTPESTIEDRLLDDPEVLGLCIDCDEPITEEDVIYDDDDFEPEEDDLESDPED